MKHSSGSPQQACGTPPALPCPAQPIKLIRITLSCVHEGGVSVPAQNQSGGALPLPLRAAGPPAAPGNPKLARPRRLRPAARERAVRGGRRVLPARARAPARGKSGPWPPSRKQKSVRNVGAPCTQRHAGGARPAGRRVAGVCCRGRARWWPAPPPFFRAAAAAAAELLGPASGRYRARTQGACRRRSQATPRLGARRARPSRGRTRGAARRAAP